MDNKSVVAAIYRLESNLTAKLAENTAQLATHTEKLDSHCDKLDTVFDKIDTLNRTVYGVGGEGDGLATRTKVLEESDKGRKKATYAVASVSIPTFLAWIWDLLKT